jgi:hypothetical protein
MQIPAKWVAVLAAIQVAAPEAFLAGGALRDLDLGREVKDLDIFVSEAGYGAAQVVLSQLDYAPANRQCLDYVGADFSVVEGREFKREGEVTVNLVCLRADFGFPSGLYRFDLGLCQIGFDGREVVKTAAYIEDATNKTLTVLRCESVDQMVRTEQRVERLQAKFPDWPSIIPAEFAQFQVPAVAPSEDLFG